MTGDVVQGDGIVMQQLFCYVTGADGLPYPCAKILVIELMEDREILMSSVSWMLLREQNIQKDCLIRHVNYMVSEGGI